MTRDVKKTSFFPKSKEFSRGSAKHFGQKIGGIHVSVVVYPLNVTNSFIMIARKFCETIVPLARKGVKALVEFPPLFG